MRLLRAFEDWWYIASSQQIDGRLRAGRVMMKLFSGRQWEGMVRTECVVSGGFNSVLVIPLGNK